jgi:hypothetical protein
MIRSHANSHLLLSVLGSQPRMARLEILART